MKPTPVAEIELDNCRTGKRDMAMFYEGASDKHIEYVERDWLPVLQSLAAQLRAKHTGPKGLNTTSFVNVLAELDLQDAHWDWRNKYHEYAGRLDYRIYTLECADTTQALMFLNLTERCRLEMQLDQHLIYINYLAVAPWNRPNLTDKRIYKGIGSLMVSNAIDVSFDEEFHGRIGLHSLPQAEKFYRDHCKMTELGRIPPKQNLIYFEMSSEQAIAFQNQGA